MNGAIVLVDTGPLVAWLARTDTFHAWAREQFAQLPAPLLVCEPVLTESTHLLGRYGQEPAALLQLIQKRVLEIAFAVEDHVPELLTLMRRYRDVPMSLADACVVRMSELHQQCRVMTTDTDFRHYRRHARQVIPLLAPW